MRALVAAVVASAATFAVVAGTGLASHDSHQTRFVFVKPGSNVTFVKADFRCDFRAKDPLGIERGPTLHCGAPSLFRNNRLRYVVISLHHIVVSDRQGDHPAYTVGR
jgi:hypothetical protein